MLNVATFLSPNYYPLYRYVAESLAERLSVAGVNFTEGQSFEEFRDKDFDLAFACGYWYAHRNDTYEPLVAPVPVDPAYKARPVYFVDLIVPSDSRINNWTHLDGRVFGVNEEFSFSGYHALRAALKNHNLPGSFIARTVKTGSHLHSIQTVISGEVDFATIDSTVLDTEFNKRPALRTQLKIVTSLGPYPAPPLLVNKALPAATRDQIRTILENLPASDLARFGIKAYQRVNRGYYAGLQQIYRESILEPGEVVSR